MAFFSLFDIKGDSVAFGKSLETGAVDCGVMNEYIAAFFLLYKTIAFFIAEPLYNPVCQNTSP